MIINIIAIWLGIWLALSVLYWIWSGFRNKANHFLISQYEHWTEVPLLLLMWPIYLAILIEFVVTMIFALAVIGVVKIWIGINTQRRKKSGQRSN